jgi:hypothetical protein
MAAKKKQKSAPKKTGSAARGKKAGSSKKKGSAKTPGNKVKMTTRKTRAKWKRAFVLDRTEPDSPIYKLAVFAINDTAGFRKKFVKYDGFNQAFDEALENANNDLLDLNDIERAFCEGWALLARRQCADTTTGEIDDATLKKWIEEQLDEPPWPYMMTG